MVKGVELFRVAIRFSNPGMTIMMKRVSLWHWRKSIPNEIFWSTYLGGLRCQIGDGVGIGGSEKKLTGFYTIQQCSDAVRLQFPNANGFTRSEPCPNRCQCFAEFGMTGWDSKQNWQSCMFSNKGKKI